MVLWTNCCPEVVSGYKVRAGKQSCQAEWRELAPTRVGKLAAEGRNGSRGPVISSKGTLARQVTRQGCKIDEGLPNMPSGQGIGYRLLVAYNEEDTTHKACARNRL